MPGLVSELQRKFRIVIACPTTLSALINSLRMGFHTLAIQKRTSDVWKVLMEATEGLKKYGDTWDMVRKQLATVSNTVEKVGTCARAVEHKLRDVKSLETAGLIAYATEAVPNGTTIDSAVCSRTSVLLCLKCPCLMHIATISENLFRNIRIYIES